MKATWALVAALFLPVAATLTAVPAYAQKASETRIEKADILKHPIGELAIKYAEALHTGKPDDSSKMTSAKAQAKWKTEPESEKKESIAFRKSLFPNGAGMKKAIESGGVLLIQDGKTATLNLTMSSSTSKGGTATASASTTGMPFVFEGGAWKIAS
jgi:hypothetical protein